MILLFLVSISFSLFSQKFGYVELDSLIEKVSKKLLRSDSLILKFEENVQDIVSIRLKHFQHYQRNVIRAMEGGCLSPESRKQLEARLRYLESEFHKMGKEIDSIRLIYTTKIEKETINKIQEEITRIGETQSFKIIFDINFLEFTDESIPNLTDEIYNRLKFSSNPDSFFQNFQTEGAEILLNLLNKSLIDSFIAHTRRDSNDLKQMITDFMVRMENHN